MAVYCAGKIRLKGRREYFDVIDDDVKARSGLGFLNAKGAGQETCRLTVGARTVALRTICARQSQVLGQEIERGVLLAEASAREGLGRSNAAGLAVLDEVLSSSGSFTGARTGLASCPNVTSRT